MIQHHNWSLTELDNMIPFERMIYLEMLIDHVDNENNSKISYIPQRKMTR